MSEKIFLTSDAHMFESEDPLHKEKAIEKGKGEQAIIKEAEKNEDNFKIVLNKVEKVGNIDYVFFGGDMVTGYGERGLVGPDSPEHISRFKKILDQTFLRDVPKKYIAGGHELGYRLPLSWDIPEGGLNERAIEVFESEFNELFYTVDKGQYKFIVLSSGLELTEGEPHITDKIKTKKKEQAEFYKDEITYIEPGRKVVLMLHDPDALRQMFDFLGKNLDKIEKTFTGHNHAQWVNKIYPYLCKVASLRALQMPLEKIINRQFPGKGKLVLDYFKANKENNKIWKAVKLMIIPAPGGMMGKGGGFLIADLKEKGIEVKKVRI